MEQEFRTTFIPKKPLVQTPVSSGTPVSRPVGIVFVISLIIFIISIMMGAGVFLYKSYLEKEVADLVVKLEKLQENIDPNAIREFSLMDKRLKNAETLINQHAVISPLFSVLRSTTLPTVRYSKFDGTFGENRDLQVTMSGESDSYRSIALQSQTLAKNANLKNTIFSNFVVTPKGRVAFDVSFSIPVSDLSFAKHTDQVTTVENIIIPPTTPITDEQLPQTTTGEITTEEAVTVNQSSDTFDGVTASGKTQ